MTARRNAAVSVPEERLAGIHLRTGAFMLALSELEALAVRGALAGPGFGLLAEARWRSGDLDGAAEAAAAHQAAGGEAPIASVILGEAAAADGRPEDSAEHMARLDGLDSEALAGIFAGMPHRAAWPTMAGPNGTGIGLGGGSEPSATDEASAGETPAAISTSAARRSRRRATPNPPANAFPDVADLVSQARDDMRSGDPERMTAAFSRLSLALRLDPGQAAGVADLLTRRSEAAAHLVRGDALRIVGRAVESEAAYAAAARTLDSKVQRGS